MVAVITLSATAGALVIVLLILLLRRCVRRARARLERARLGPLDPAESTIQLSPHSTHFSDDNLEALGAYHERPRRPSFAEKSRRKEGEKYGLVGRHGASSSDEEAHTLLYELIALWRACLQQRGSGHASPRSARAGERAGERAPGGGPGHQRSGSNMSTSSVSMLLNDAAQAAPSEVDVLIEPFIDAFGMMLSNLLTPVFGSTMVLAVKNDEGNIAKVRQALVKQSAANGGVPPTLRAVLSAERAQGMHAPGRLADPSAAVALLWMHRSLSFQHAMLDGLCSRRDTKLADVAREAYTKHLEANHSWLLKNTFKMSLSSLPTRDELYSRLAPSTRRADEREQICLQEIREFSLAAGPVVQAIRSTFEELGLSDDKKA